MTVRKRLVWSNILMILVPVLVTVLVGLCCLGAVYLMLVHGASLGIRDQEDFGRASLVAAEAAEKQLEMGVGLKRMENILDSNGMTMTVFRGSEIVDSYGTEKPGDQALLTAVIALPGDVTLTSGGRSLFLHRASINGADYTVCLLGSTGMETGMNVWKAAMVLCALVLALAIVLSILLTNRFLTKFVFRRIEEPLDILSQGVHQLGSGNLDFQIACDRNDEFRPICQDFNEMARHLKESVTQLQSEQRSRKVLIAGISHDIRSPLTSIRAYVEGLLDGIAKTPEAQRKYLTTIKTKAEDLEHIVSQLFLFSKLELGEGAENRVPMRLDHCIVDTVNGIREEYSQKGLTIRTELDNGVITADPIQIQRIVLNIAQNSLKYKEKSCGQLVIGLYRENGRLLLCFDDDGPGVPQESMEHLFEVFYRSDPARRNPGTGSGLGLAIVAEAAAQSGGAVSASQSSLGGLRICIAWREDDGKDSDCGR